MLVLKMTLLAIVLLLARRLAFAQPKEVFVPMRDGARLALDLHFPSGPSNGLPVALERTPYNKFVFRPGAKFWTERGYVYAVQDVRGRSALKGDSSRSCATGRTASTLSNGWRASPGVRVRSERLGRPKTRWSSGKPRPNSHRIWPPWS